MTIPNKHDKLSKYRFIKRKYLLGIKAEVGTIGVRSARGQLQYQKGVQGGPQGEGEV